MEEKDSLASELLHLVKTQARRWFIAFIVVLIMLFATNLAWLYAWNLPSEESTSESYDIQSEDNGNAVYNESGGVNICTSESDENWNSKTYQQTSFKKKVKEAINDNFRIYQARA